MKCCTRCFNDTNIQNYIDKYDDIGTCDYCNSKGVSILDVSTLGEYVRMCLQKGYEDSSISDIPYFLVESHVQTVMDVLDFKEDIFSDELNWESKTQVVSDLLKESAPNYRDIAQGDVDEFEDENTEVILKNVFYGADNDFYIHTWKGFKELVMHGNRFFDLLENQMRIKMLETFDEFFEEMLVDLNKGTILFRARTGMPNDMNQLELMESEIGPPPANIAVSLRMNPVGISYLYLAEDIATCKKEIKADVGETIGIGYFETIESLKLVDLSQVPRLKNASIFSKNYNHELNWIRPFLENFCEEISKPIEKNYDLEYLPTQLLCEYIRFRGYDGIRYRSSITGKKCYTLFCGQQKQTSDVANSLIKDFKDWVKLIKFQQYGTKTFVVESVKTFS